MDPSEVPSGGLPWSVAIPAFVAMATVVGALWLNRISSGNSYGTLLREKDAEIAAAERRTDALEKSFREHLEHDARLFRGERDRRPTPRHLTGNQALDEGRDRAERNSRQISPELLAAIRESIGRGQGPLGG